MPRTVVAVLGTGTMGTGIARNIAAAGFDLRVWNRTAARARALAATGATVAASPGEAVRGADLVLTMLWDAGSTAEVIGAAAGSFAPGAVWIQAGTVGVDGERRLADLAAEFGLVYVDAPVLGTRRPAEEGTLRILASGPEEALDRCAGVFDAIGSRTLRVGPAGSGSRLKLAVNAWVLLLMEGIAECLAYAGSLGLDPALLLEAVRDGPLDTSYLHTKGRAILAGDFTPSFTVAGAVKDATLILEAAGSPGTAGGTAGGTDGRADEAVQLGLLECVRDHMLAALGAGYGDLDMAATYLAHLPGTMAGGR